MRFFKVTLQTEERRYLFKFACKGDSFAHAEQQALSEYPTDKVTAIEEMSEFAYFDWLNA